MVATITDSYAQLPKTDQDYKNYAWAHVTRSCTCSTYVVELGCQLLLAAHEQYHYPETRPLRALTLAGC